MKVDVGGYEMYFDVEGAKLVPDGTEMIERPTIVLLHGGPGMDHSGFKPHYSTLADVAQVVYVDHSGQGRSDPTPPERWNLDDWADDIVRFCDALAIENPVILGWSFGGVVAMNLAARYPDRLSKLILQSTVARIDVGQIAAAMGELGGPEAGAAAKAFFTEQTPESIEQYSALCLPLVSPQPVDFEAMQRIVMTPELTAGGWTEALTYDLTDLIGAVEVPTLVLSGDLDPNTPPAAAAEIVEHLPAGLTTHRTFARSGHFINETETDAFFEAIRNFL